MNLRRMLAAVLAAAVFSAGGVTTFAADTTRIKTEAARPSWTQRRAERFEELLEAGVVSQSSYEKIRAYLEENLPQKPERAKRGNTLDKLLEAGVITQAEHDALKAAIASPGTRPEGLGEARQSNPFARFVTDGIISEETAAAIGEYLGTNRPAVTEKARRGDILTKLLDAGAITQAEYDAIKAAMPESLAKAATAAAKLAG